MLFFCAKIAHVGGVGKLENLKFKIGDTLRFFRNLRGFTQKEVLHSSADHSIYSRIENGKRSVRLEELQEILDTLSVNVEEFVAFSDFDTKQGIFRKEFYAVAVDLENANKKLILMEYYQELLSTQNKTAIQLSNLISIKAYFSQFWPEIEPVNSQDIQESYELLSNTRYLLQYDYTLLANVIYYVSATQRQLLMKKAFPIIDLQLRDLETLKHAYQAIPNVITVCIQEKQYDEARNYIKLVDNIDRTGKNLYHIMSIKYLENLVNYIVTGDRIYQKKINRYIDILQENGFQSVAKDTAEEVRRFTFGEVKKDEMPVNTL